jgi:hypothetical protein
MPSGLLEGSVFTRTNSCDILSCCSVDRSLKVDVNGLWLAEFSTQDSQGSGVIVLLNGRALGGDAHYYYAGSYSLNGAQVSGSLSVTHYSGPLNNVFGPLRSLTLSLSGAAGHDLIVLSGVDKAFPEMLATFRLRRVQTLEGWS